MKMMNCPLNGLRNISEFVHGGEVKEMPDPNSCSDKEWADYVFFSDNAISVVTEWWLHAPSGYWFIAERHTGSDEILKTYDPSVLFSERVEFSAPATEVKA
ncbi:MULTISPECIES: sarcosine oxidase subunit delta [Neptuniibacter]|mgnify:CR=1 FL=1|jgi:sarcosine oxidase subunit delta|uniref:sarcosine oxidase subunit delta n=1 Tax=Neptuniibacter TaxID=459520 RepID=UPI00082F8C69|nr:MULTISPECIES: sarcosine oxidase subunit delta [Neptuniibacter]MDO6593693.1 sarcosine oxidase subunit delta [Neptuniibacter sp. 1_MG-2023]